jgi:hypothetical protein
MLRAVVELGSMDEVLTPGLAMTNSNVTLNMPRGVFLMAVVRAIPISTATEERPSQI